MGYYTDTNYANHGFIRSARGKFTEFDVRGAGKGDDQGTVPEFINSAGAITGYYTDTDYVYHGFVTVTLP